MDGWRRAAGKWAVGWGEKVVGGGQVWAERAGQRGVPGDGLGVGSKEPKCARLPSQ